MLKPLERVQKFKENENDRRKMKNLELICLVTENIEDKET